MVKHGTKICAALVVVALAGAALAAAARATWAPAKRTWGVHDVKRPQPKVIDPGAPGTPDRAARPPSDAVVLFDGTDLSKWVTKKRNKKTKREQVLPAAWKVENGYMEAVKKSGSIYTKQAFGSCQLHVEWASPVTLSSSTGQQRGNSGVFLMGVYELQILDSYRSKTYHDGQAASMYGQNPPLVNACRKPGEWQSFDIIFHRPRFDAAGKCVRPGTITVLHNGVLVQDHHAIWGATAHKKVAMYRRHPDKMPIGLQDHGHAVRFRNIWVRPIPDGDETPQ